MAVKSKCRLFASGTGTVSTRGRSSVNKILGIIFLEYVSDAFEERQSMLRRLFTEEGNEDNIYLMTREDYGRHALPSPTSNITFSVPARRPLSWPAPWISGSTVMPSLI